MHKRATSEGQPGTGHPMETFSIVERASDSARISLSLSLSLSQSLSFSRFINSVVFVILPDPEVLLAPTGDSGVPFTPPWRELTSPSLPPLDASSPVISITTL